MKRIEYLDSAKAYLIFLVVIGHILIVLNPAYDRLLLTACQAYIYAFHMPAFFIIHGITFNNEKWRSASVSDFLKKRVKTIVIPYFFFEALGIAWKTVFLHQGFSDGLYYMFTLRCNVGADWFLPALLIGDLIYLFFIKYGGKSADILAVIAAFMLPMMLPHNQLSIILSRGLIAYGFVKIGNMLSVLLTEAKYRNICCGIVFAVITAACAVFDLKFGGNDLYAGIIKNPITLVIGGLSGTMFVFCAAEILKLGLVNTIGRHTLTVMGTHQLVIYLACSLNPSLRGGNLAGGLLLLCAITVFEIPVVYIFDNYLPFLVGRK